MIINLPANFRYGDKECIREGILKIPSHADFRMLMYQLAIANKGKKCWYCGRRLAHSEITMDHLYPQDLGGPTISDNLVPTCGKCNSSKNNFTEQQYQKMIHVDEDTKKKLRSIYYRQNEERKKKGFVLPKTWVKQKKIDTISFSLTVGDGYRGKQYNRIAKFYRTYHHFPNPVIVDKVDQLLDGFPLLIYAKDNGIEKVPVIKLDNVEKM